jgi:hypothetical protein
MYWVLIIWFKKSKSKTSLKEWRAKARLFRVAVEEQVRHHVPLADARQHAAELEHLTRQQPPHEPDAVHRLRHKQRAVKKYKLRLLMRTSGIANVVVARDGQIDAAQRRVGVAECDHRNVHERRLADCLMVIPGVRHDEQSRLFEVLL